MKIRLLQSDDVNLLFNFLSRNNELTLRYFPITNKANSTLLGCKAYIKESIAKNEQKEFYPFVLILNKELIGMIMIKNLNWRIPKAELAYFIDPNYQAQGLMSKAMEFILKLSFKELNIYKLIARIDPSNIASIRLVEKFGFKLEAKHEKEFRIETGELRDILFYSLFNKNLEV